MFKKLLLLFLFVSVLSCKNQESQSPKTTWISGQIVNPVLDYIVFAQGDLIMDTVKLDSNNFFLYKSEDIKPGLYSFKHSESQVFYIEPGDSLLMHVNTIDFDESLAYSGTGAAQNNLLMDFFLSNEIDNRNLYKWYSLPPQEFEAKTDSLKAVKVALYNDFLENHEVDEKFRQIAKATINYYNYSKKELYIAAHMRRNQDIPKSFLAYREKIDFDKNGMRFYYPYYRFLNRYFDNVVTSKYKDIPSVNRSSYDYNYKKLKLIDSLVTNDSLKNSLLRYNTRQFLLSAQDAEEEKRVVAEFLRLSTDKKHQEEMKALMEASVNLSSGQPLPNVIVVSANNEAKNLESIVKSPTVFYFWSQQSVAQFRNIHNRAKELKSKFPEYDFIGINTDTHFKKWLATLKKTGFKPATEFQLENVADAERKLLLNSMSKVIVVDRNGVILNGNTNMFNNNFEQLLLGYLNR